VTRVTVSDRQAPPKSAPYGTEMARLTGQAAQYDPHTRWVMTASSGGKVAHATMQEHHRIVEAQLRC
jgi:hypothetical protein